MNKVYLLLSLLVFSSQKVKCQTVSEVWNYAYKIGVEHSEVVVAQSILETGWYKCKDCSLAYNNLFGFRHKGEYLKFTHWKQSVDYYKNWQRRWYKGGDYFAFLCCIDFGDGKCHGYAEDMKSYVVKLEQIIWKLWSC